MGGRLGMAARFAARAVQRPSMGARSMATGPVPLSIRMDGLFTQCCIAAVIYFVPQDLVFVGGLLAHWHSRASAISPCKTHKDVDEAIEEYKAKKGLDKVKV